MRIVQIVTTLGYGDAIGNNILALLEVLKEKGYSTTVYAEKIDVRITSEYLDDIRLVDEMKNIEDDDVILYHLATAADLNRRIAGYPGKKVLCYHNITPPTFFESYSEQVVQNCQRGLYEVRRLKNKVDYCLADSDFNRKDLVRMGFSCGMDVLPILIRFEDYLRQSDEETVEKLQDGYENILFVGRIAPNKKQEDVIAAYAMYKSYYNPKSRLILAGSYQGMEKYYECLKTYVEKNNIEDVVFTSHIRFEELLAYYRTADMFLCMSEHEGFCVPLVEAMYFDVPIIAYDSYTAIGETLGGAGVLLQEKNPLETAAWMNRVNCDRALRETVIRNQRERLHDFSADKIKERFFACLNKLIGE